MYSLFSLNTNDCKYFTPVEFSKAFYCDNILSMFSVNCRSLEAYWDSEQELPFNISSNGLQLDIIGLI